MRSLFCVTHPDWDSTISEIVEKGGKVGKGEFTMHWYPGARLRADVIDLAWIENKKRSGFAFAAMCWEKSFIPLEIWKAGDANTNIVESVHSDINLEGVWCTLLGGIMKAKIYDWNKMEALKVWFLFPQLGGWWLNRLVQNKEKSGIRPSYQQQHPVENAEKMLKRKCTFLHDYDRVLSLTLQINA